MPKQEVHAWGCASCFVFGATHQEHPLPFDRSFGTPTPLPKTVPHFSQEALQSYLKPIRTLFRRWPLFNGLMGIAGGLTLWAVLFILWPLPDAWTQTDTARSVRITDRNGQLLYEARPDGAGRPIDLAKTPRLVFQTLMATEDRQFLRHRGVDPLAAVQALGQNVSRGEVIRGGSTLTMQVARMLRGEPRGGWRRWWNKLAEMLLAWRIEAHHSKAEIMAMWLNRAPFGNRTFGLASAAQFYFGKPVHDLNIPEIAFLIGLPQSPSAYNPFSHPDLAKRRQREVLQNLVEVGLLEPKTAAQYGNLALSISKPEQVFRAPHLSAWLSQQLPLRALGAQEVRTTLDLRLQTIAEEILRGQMRRIGQSNVTNAGLLVLDNQSGEILVYAGSVDFWEDRTGGQNDAIRALRQPGSSLKPFTYAWALGTRRYTPASILPDLPIQILEVGGAFSPENYDKKYHGPVPVREALACSYNIPAVRMAREAEPSVLLKTFRRAGLISLTKPAEHYGVGLTLGNGEITLLELARAYSGLANGGKLPGIRFLQNPDYAAKLPQDPLYQPGNNGISAQVAYLITHILSDPEARAPAFGRGNPLELPFPVAAKTGTSKDYRDNWVVGYTPRYTVAVWAGNFDGSPMQYVSGISGAGPIFHDMMMALGNGGDFVVPPGIQKTVICTASGKRPGAFCNTTREDVFFEGTAPQDTCKVHQNFRINIETGDLADANTPSTLVRNEVFTVYPPEFHMWMQENGWRLPPRNTERNIAITDPNLIYSEALQVQYPASGTVYLVDPVLRRDYQRIRLKGVVSDAFYNLRWVVDEIPLSSDYRHTDWMLSDGTHHIRLQGVTQNGKRVSSVPVQIRVLPAGKE